MREIISRIDNVVDSKTLILAIGKKSAKVCINNVPSPKPLKK